MPRGGAAWRRVLAGSYLYLGFALLLIVGVLINRHFLSGTNLRNVLQRESGVGLLAVGMTLVILTAGIDLSVGSLLSLGSVLCAMLVSGRTWNASSYVLIPCATAAVLVAGGLVAYKLLARAKLRPLLRLVLALTSGAVAGGLAAWWTIAMVPKGYSTLGVMICVPLVTGLLGALNGTLIAKCRLQPFIVTLAMMIAAVGLAKVIAGKGGQVRRADYPSGEAEADEKIAADRAKKGLGFAPQSLAHVGRGYVLWDTLPVTGLAFLVAVAGGHFLLTRTPFGRYTYAVGGNEEAARLSGVNVDRVKITVYALSGALSGLAGVLYCAQYGQGAAIAGDKKELAAIAAVVIGGTSLMGGRGKILGTLVGVLFFAYLTNILNLARFTSDHQQVVTGATIIIAVILQEGWVARWLRMARARFTGRREMAG
jgi:simple sugar transport system permease protein